MARTFETAAVVQAAPAAAPAPAEETGEYWGDRVAFRLWVFCFVFMCLMGVFNFVERS